LLFNDLQRKAFNYLEKPNIFNEEQMKYFEGEKDKKIEIIEFIKEFKGKLESKTIDCFQKKLIIMHLMILKVKSYKIFHQ
jgi:hypothetical protein